MNPKLRRLKKQKKHIHQKPERKNCAQTSSNAESMLCNPVLHVGTPWSLT